MAAEEPETILVMVIVFTKVTLHPLWYDPVMIMNSQSLNLIYDQLHLSVCLLMEIKPYKSPH